MQSPLKVLCYHTFLDDNDDNDNDNDNNERWTVTMIVIPLIMME
jgi:hypothetical protein